MELSPKQQTVEQIKNAERVLILGHKNPSGDHLGSLLALSSAFKKLDKKVETVVSDIIPDKYQFLRGLETINKELKLTNGKVIKVDTKNIPISGMKWQKDDNSLSIILDTEKNLKFEHIEIINGDPKPNVIIVVDTQKIEEMDSAYDKNNELFFEIPIINIDHHAGNEYFGTINLIDLTAASTSEILVSLFEALGVKIDSPEIATHLLAGIIEDTHSFQNISTTPKSLTVAAQLLAAGAKQQEIVSNLYGLETSNNDLMRLWDELVRKIEIDKNHRFAWTKVEAEKNDVFEASFELLEKTKEADTVLVICFNSDGAHGKFVGENAIELSKLFDVNDEDEGVKTAEGKSDSDQITTEFDINAENINEAEKIILKKIYDFWQGSKETKTEGKEVWKVIEQSPNTINHESKELKNIETKEQKDREQGTKEQKTENSDQKSDDEDAIEEALRSIEQSQDEQDRVKGLTSIRDLIDRKRVARDLRPETRDQKNEIDVFEETE